MRSKLEKETLLLSKWFSKNFMKLNKDMCLLLIFGASKDGVTISIRATEVSNFKF